MISAIGILNVFLFFVAISVFVNAIRAGTRRHELRRVSKLSVKELGTMEGQIENLKRVIVVADHIEAPEQTLRESVTANLRRGVPYLFLVSESRVKEEINGYFKIYEALGEIAASGISPATNRPVQIKKLPYDWNGFPYIFYETQAPDEETSKYHVFKGDQEREGIAEVYVRLSPNEARIIAMTTLSGAPEPITTSTEQFVKTTNVIPLRTNSDRQSG